MKLLPALLLLTLPASAARADWPMFRGDPQLSGVASTTLPDQPQLLYTFTTQGPIKAQVAVHQNTAVIGSHDGQLYAFDTTTGAQRWSFHSQDNDPWEATPLILNNTVYIGSTDFNFYALNLTDGTERWRYPTEDMIHGAANYDTRPDGGTNIVFGSYDYKLHAVDAQTGAPQWVHTTENYLNGAPAIHQHQAIIGGCDGNLHIVNTHTGTPQNTIPVNAYIAGSATLTDHHVYLGHYGNQFISVDLQTHAIDWSYGPRKFPFFSSPALHQNILYFGGRDKRLHAVHAQTGEAQWTFRTRGRVDSSPVVVGDRILVGSDDGRIYLLDHTTGQATWSWNIGQALTASPAVANRKIFIGSEDGNVYVFGQTRETQP